MIKLPFNLSKRIHRVVIAGRLKPRGRMQLQRCLDAIVLNVLRAVQRMRDQLLQHLRTKLPVLYVKAKVLIRRRPHIDLRRQVVLHDRFGRVCQTLKVTLDPCRRKHSITVNVNRVNVRLGVPEQRQLLTSLAELGKMAVLANVARVLAVTDDTVILYRTLATMLAGVGLLARIHVLAVVERDIAHHPLTFHQIAWLNFNTIDFEIPQTTDQTGCGRFQAAADDELIANVEGKSVHLRDRVAIVYDELDVVPLVRQLNRVPGGWVFDANVRRVGDVAFHVRAEIEAEPVGG